MTKALLCCKCMTMRTFVRDGSVTTCDCGLITGWWEDPAKGIAKLYTETLMGKQYGRIIGMHNGFLQAETEPNFYMPDPMHRQNHNQATHAPGYLFDKTRRDCWAIIITPGESNDTAWATDEQWQQKTT